MKCLLKLFTLAVAVLFQIMMLLGTAQAQVASSKPEPLPILKQAADYISSAKNLEVEADITFDAVLSPNLIAQDTGKFSAKMSRPDRLAVTYQDSAEVTKLWYDGKVVTYLVGETNHFAKLDGEGSIESTLGGLYQDYGLMLPLTRLLFVDAYSEITSSGNVVTYIGNIKMGDARVHHIAVHGGKIDLQLWIDSGEAPVIRQLVAIDRVLPGAPRYSARFNKFVASDEMSGDPYTPALPDDARETRLHRLKR